MNYTRHYGLLIERARARTLSGYSERHHILPKCLGGTDDASNLVRLTAEEHFVAHQLLVKIYPDSKGITYAAFAMGNKNNKKYGWLRRLYSSKLTGVPRPDHALKVSGENNGMYGKTHSESARARVSEFAKQRVGSKNPMFGVKHSEESLAKIRGRVVSDKQKLKQSVLMKSKPVVVCPHCGKEGKGGNMVRYHFENCISPSKAERSLHVS